MKFEVLAGRNSLLDEADQNWIKLNKVMLKRSARSNWFLKIQLLQSQVKIFLGATIRSSRRSCDQRLHHSPREAIQANDFFGF